MARPRRVSDDEIFAAVRKAVQEQGPQVSLDVVAEHLGVTAPALFRRFGNRGALLIAALGEQVIPPFIPMLDRGPDERPIEVQLSELITAITRHLITALPCILALRESGLGDLTEQATPVPPPILAARAISGWLARAAERGLLAVEHPDDTALMLLGAIQAPVFIHHVAKSKGELDPAAYGQRLTQTLLRGLAPTAPSHETRSPRHDRPPPVRPLRDEAPRRAGPLRRDRQRGLP